MKLFIMRRLSLVAICLLAGTSTVNAETLPLKEDYNSAAGQAVKKNLQVKNFGSRFFKVVVCAHLKGRGLLGAYHDFKCDELRE